MSERHFACITSDLAPGSSLIVAGTEPAIALHRTLEGKFFATADNCTHEDFSLGEEGEVEGAEIICPLHMARFDLATGAPLCLPATRSLATYKVEIDEDQVYVTSG